MSCMIDCIKSGHFWLFFIQLFFSVHLHVSFCEQLHFQFESAMKIILMFVAACALFSTVHSAPFDSVVKSQDGDVKEFHFYDKAARIIVLIRLSTPIRSPSSSLMSTEI